MKRADAPKKLVDRPLQLGDPFYMRNEAASLHRKNESLGSAFPPCMNRGQFGQAIKSGIDLHRIKVTGVKNKMLARFGLAVEIASPFLVFPTTCADKNFTGRHKENFHSSVAMRFLSPPVRRF